MQEFHKERTAKEKADKIIAAQAAKDKQEEMEAMAKVAKREKKLDKEANDVLPFMDSKMKSVRKTKDITAYSNLMCELLFEDEKQHDGMANSDLFDFSDITHRMTVYELKEKVSPFVKCEPWMMGEVKFYNKKGKMRTANDNDKRLFESGINDGVKITIVKDEDGVKPEVKPQVVKKIVVPEDTRPMAEKVFELMKK